MASAFESSIRDDYINVDLGEDPIYTLVYNIVLQAVKDFRYNDNVLHNEKKTYKERESALFRKEEVINFFKSDWYNFIMSTCDNVEDNGLILDKLIEESEELYGTEFEFKIRN